MIREKSKICLRVITKSSEGGNSISKMKVNRSRKDL